MENIETNVIGQLSEPELKIIQDLNTNLNRLKFQLGEIEISKQFVFKEIEDIRYNSKVNEQKMIKKFGENVVINIKTGEVTKNGD